MKACISLLFSLALTGLPVLAFAQADGPNRASRVPDHINSWAELFRAVSVGMEPVDLIHRGMLESVATAKPRPLMTGSEDLGFLPQRGGFTFPEPYNTQAIRITNADDCGGKDCVHYVGYSYWSNINNHVGQNSFYVMLGMLRDQGGLGANIWEVNKATHRVTDLGPLFPGASNLSYATTEGWYFSTSMATKLYVPTASQLRRYDIVTKEHQIVLDVTDDDKAGPGHVLWQTSSSADDAVHAMTIRTLGDYRSLACAVFWEDSGAYKSWPVSNEFDECRIDLSGQWLHIIDEVKTDQGKNDNIVINLETLQERIITDVDGAGGHGGHGFGGVVQADNWSVPGAYRYFDYSAEKLDGKLVFLLYNWELDAQEWRYMAPQHISFLNSRPTSEVPIDDQYACGATASNIEGPFASEVICFRMREVKYQTQPDGRLRITQDNAVLVVAPTMTDASQDGLATGTYGLMPKGNLDVTGEYFIWTTNTGGANGENRLDAFIVKVPHQRFNQVD